MTILCALLLIAMSHAGTTDWYLYFWSESNNLNSDAGQFTTTDQANIFVLPSCSVPAEGINFCVHNQAWSAVYGWDSEAVTATGVAVSLATATQATGWLALPAGTYDVTFDLSVPSIRFDTVAATQPQEPEQPEDPEPQSSTFLRGGDLTMAKYLEDWGAVFRYRDGTAGDVFDILSNYGINLARLRLFHNPGTAVQSGGTTYRLPIMTTAHPSGYPYAGEEDILSLALRAKQHNMQICLTIYLSDYWAGATEQYIPAAWANVSDLNTLGDSVYNYVYRIMTRMEAQGTLPEFVSVGNETNYGILYQRLNGTHVNFGGDTRDGISNTVFLFNKAYDAIKAVSPSSQVIIHHSYGDAGKIGTCRSFFQNMLSNGCRFDIVGGSYYPHWATEHGAADATPTGMLAWAADMEQNIGKPVMLMEVGYSWNPYKCPGRNGGNWQGQLGLNGAYNEATEAGQEAFIKALHEALDTDDNILGYMYWDPIFVDQQVGGQWIKTCWAEKYDAGYDTWWEDGNVISNTTLFDFTGLPLSALYREIKSRKPAEVPTGSEVIEATAQPQPSACTKRLVNGHLLLEHQGQYYTIFGQKAGF